MGHASKTFHKGQTFGLLILTNDPRESEWPRYIDQKLHLGR